MGGLSSSVRASRSAQHSGLANVSMRLFDVAPAANLSSSDSNSNTNSDMTLLANHLGQLANMTVPRAQQGTQ